MPGLCRSEDVIAPYQQASRPVTRHIRGRHKPTIFLSCATPVTWSRRSGTGWLSGSAPRGLSFNQDKTRIVHVDEGCDFLGFNIRRYGGRLLIKPSIAAVRRFRERLTAEVRSLRGSNSLMVIITLNPIIGGWAAYHRSVVSKKVFTTVDGHLWQLTYRWALRTHPNNSKHWVVTRYFGRFNMSRQNRWTFGDRGSGAYLRRLDWTKIVRNRMVMGTSSPDDPALTEYWADRRRRRPAPLNTPTLRLFHAQNGRCPARGSPGPARRSRTARPTGVGTADQVRPHHAARHHVQRRAGRRPTRTVGRRHYEPSPVRALLPTTSQGSRAEVLQNLTTPQGLA